MRCQIRQSVPLAAIFFGYALSTATKVLASSAGSSTAPPGSIPSRHGFNQDFASRVEMANSLAALEQRVEDWNANYIATSKTTEESRFQRRLICLPVDEDLFNPSMGQFDHDHVQTCDKVSLPHAFYDTVVRGGFDPPWLYSVTRVTDDHFIQQPRVKVSDELVCKHDIEEIVVGPMDFRSPGNFIFLSRWMMRALGLQPRDVVNVRFKTDVPPGAKAVFRPHTDKFTTKVSEPTAVLESELRHYSALVEGTTIAFDYNGERYWFDVVELRAAPKNERQKMVKVQDTNLITSFTTSREKIKRNEEEKRKRREAKEANED